MRCTCHKVIQLYEMIFFVTKECSMDGKTCLSFCCPAESMRVTIFRRTVHQYYTNPLTPRLPISSLPITHFPYQVRAQRHYGIMAEVSTNLLVAFKVSLLIVLLFFLEKNHLIFFGSHIFMKL